jgi:hypothetical protein
LDKLTHAACAVGTQMSASAAQRLVVFN